MRHGSVATQRHENPHLLIRPARSRRGFDPRIANHTTLLSFSGSLKVFVAVEPCAMRRSFNGLHDAVSTRLMKVPKSEPIYTFTNKRPTLLKIFYWDGSKL